MIESYRHPEHFDVEGKRDLFVAETTKVSEITDKFGHTRYKIVLTDFDPTLGDYDSDDSYHDDLRRRDEAFQIEVWCYVIGQNPILVFRSDIIEGYAHALKMFYDKVDAYSSFVKAETKEVQNIWMYSDKIHYHIVDPKRCANCKFAKPIPNHGELYSRDRIGKFECTNLVVSKTAKDCSIDSMKDYDAGHREYESRDHYMPIHPEVDKNGICDFYQSKKDLK